MITIRMAGRGALAGLMICGMATGGMAARAQGLSPDMPFDVAHLPTPDLKDWNDFAWESFVAANWPVAPGHRGEPDKASKIGAKLPDGSPVPVLWMTSKGVPDVFLPFGAEPSSDWPSQAPTKACEAVPGYDAKTSYVLGMTSKTNAGATTAINQAEFPGSGQVVGPVIDQNAQYLRYDIRMSESEFQYLLNERYYNAGVQIAAVQAVPTTFVDPPKGTEKYVQALPEYARYGTVEYKASWRLLDPKSDIVSRYFTAKAFVVEPDGDCHGPHLMGLTGLHIIRLTPTTGATWVWSTFEQVDNLTKPPVPPRPDGRPVAATLSNGTTNPAGYNYTPPPVVPGQKLPPGKPVDVSRVTPIQDASKPVTSEYQKALAGTVWANYELVGVQAPVNPRIDGKTVTDNKGKGGCFVAGTDHDAGAAYQLTDCYLANVSMETYVQSTSCATCHSYGAPQGVEVPDYDKGKANPRPTFNALDTFQIFSFMLKQAKMPMPDKVPPN
jgi:hypothetical protein